MKCNKLFKLISFTLLLVALLSLFTTTVMASSGTSGDVATAVQNTWTSAKTQIQAVVDNVVFPALTMILAVLFFVKVGACYFDFRKHGQFEYTAPAILFACLIFTVTAPLYIWSII